MLKPELHQLCAFLFHLLRLSSSKQRFRKPRLSISTPHFPCQRPPNSASFPSALHPLPEWSARPVVNHYARQIAKSRPNEITSLPQIGTVWVLFFLFFLFKKKRGKVFLIATCVPIQPKFALTRIQPSLAPQPGLRTAGAHAWLGPVSA